jgi:hypothetical protein
MAETVKILWALTIALELAVLLLMAGKRQYRDFPGIFIYLLTNLIQVPVIFAVYSFKGFTSWPAFWTGWVSQAVIVTARWLAVCELCRNVLGHFEGIWALTWRVLAVLGSLALLVALALGRHDFTRLISTFDLGLEFSMATVLVGFFLFARYYRVEVQNSLRSIGIAFCLYSIFRAFNDSVLQTFLRNYSNTWNVVDGVTYIATLTLIGSAVYVLRSEDVRKVVLLPRTAYAELAPHVNERLKALNERLNHLLNSKKAGQG